VAVGAPVVAPVATSWQPDTYGIVPRSDMQRERAAIVLAEGYQEVRRMTAGATHRTQINAAHETSVGGAVCAVAVRKSPHAIPAASVGQRAMIASCQRNDHRELPTMKNQNEVFGRLLKAGIASIANCAGKTAAVVEENLGATSTCWRKYAAGFVPRSSRRSRRPNRVLLRSVPDENHRATRQELPESCISGVSADTIQRYKSGFVPPDTTSIKLRAEAAMRRGFLGSR